MQSSQLFEDVENEQYIIMICLIEFLLFFFLSLFVCLSDLIMLRLPPYERRVPFFLPAMPATNRCECFSRHSQKCGNERVNQAGRLESHTQSHIEESEINEHYKKSKW